MNFTLIKRSMAKHAATAGFSMPKGIGDALKPAPAPMKIDAPKQAPGNAQMEQAAAAEGVGANAGSPTDPVAALTASLDKITAVAKSSLPQAQKPVGDPAVTQAPAEPNPAQIAQQQNQTAPQPGVPKLASVSKGKLLLYKLIKG